MKKIHFSIIIIVFVLMICIPTFAIYISYSIGNKSITYALKIEQTVNSVEANSPKLANGMIPITWNAETTKWEVTDIQNTDNCWYNYFSQKWANIMMSDGNKYIAQNISTDNDNNGYDDETGKKIANIGDQIEEDQLGSMFVWIPRYEYKIDVEQKKIKVRYIAINGQTTDGYILHPVFKDGTDTNFENGEWDQEIDGFWFAKFEASTREEDSAVQILPNKPSANGISINDCYQKARTVKFDMQNETDIQNINSHMVKNSEWGAVTYLSWSNYGTNARDISINNYFNRNNKPNAITGLASQGKDTRETIVMSEVLEYNTEDGQKASTTENIYGIYDMKGGVTEYTASVLNGKTLNNIDDGSKYITKYTSGINKIGDAIKETESWNGDNNVMITSTNPYFMRGEPGTSAVLAGIFAYNGGNGTASIFRGYRISLIVE